MSLWSPLPAGHQQSSSAKLKGCLFVFTVIEEGMVEGIGSDTESAGRGADFKISFG